MACSTSGPAPDAVSAPNPTTTVWIPFWLLTSLIVRTVASLSRQRRVGPLAVYGAPGVTTAQTAPFGSVQRHAVALVAGSYRFGFSGLQFGSPSVSRRIRSSRSPESG